MIDNASTATWPSSTVAVVACKPCWGELLVMDLDCFGLEDGNNSNPDLVRLVLETTGCWYVWSGLVSFWFRLGGSYIRFSVRAWNVRPRFGTLRVGLLGFKSFGIVINKLSLDLDPLGGFGLELFCLTGTVGSTRIFCSFSAILTYHRGSGDFLPGLDFRSTSIC
jgi:hypothetical protein